MQGRKNSELEAGSGEGRAPACNYSRDTLGYSRCSQREIEQGLSTWDGNRRAKLIPGNCREGMCGATICWSPQRSPLALLVAISSLFPSLRSGSSFYCHLSYI